MAGIVGVLQERFLDVLLEVNPQHKRYGMKQRHKHAAQSTATFERRPADRTLLDIEQQARQNREADHIARLQFVEFTKAHLLDQVAEELFIRLGNFDAVNNTVFNLAQGFPEVLDALCARAVTLSQLENLINKLDWLKEDLLKLVNQPKYRNKTPSGNFIKEIKPALGLIGLESLKQILPLLALRRCVPHSTDPFTSFKTNMWQYSLSVAVAAQRLAEETGDNQFVAYCAGLFNSLGYYVVTRNYLRTYAQIKQAELLKARDARDTQLTDALDGLDADASFLISCFQEFASIISADLVAQWPLKRIPLRLVMDQRAEGVGYSGATDLTRLIAQAEYFVQAKILRSQKLLNDAEDMAWRQAVQLRPDYLHILQNTPLDPLDLE